MSYKDLMSAILDMEIGEYDADGDKINSMLDVLTPTEREVIELKYGVGPYENTHTLKEIASIYGVGFERIRQVHAKAIGKMQQPFKARGICQSSEPVAD